MNEGFRQYGVLLKALVRNNLYNLLRARRNRIKTSKDRAKSAGLAVAVVFGILAFVFFEVMIAFSLASSAFKSGLYDEVIYVFLTAAQLIVFFFGILTVTSNLYFSKDNAILAPMPFRRSVVFSAKFTVAYFGELFISALFVIPTTVTVGVVAAVIGFPFPWYYYPLCVAAAFVAPIVPLILISFVSVPLMRLAAVFKRHKVGQALAMTVLYGTFIALYFAMIIGFNANDPGESLSGGAVDAIRVVKEIGILNLPLVALMTGVKLTSDGVIATVCVSLGVAALIALTFAAGAFVSFTSEEGSAAGARRKRKSITVFEAASTPGAKRSVYSAFLVKELKTLLNTPVLLMNVILTLVLPAVMMVFFRLVYSGGEEFDMFTVDGVNMLVLGMITYVCFLVCGSSNPVSSIGFSREGKNLLYLKTLPVSAKVIVYSKLAFATAVSVISVIFMAVAFPFCTGIYNPVAIVLFPILMLAGSFASNCMLLFNDLKNPNYTWNNISEISKNNKRLVKPMLLNLLIGLAYAVLACVLGSLKAGGNAYGVLGIFFGVSVVPPIIISVLALGKLTADPQKFFDEIGG